MQCIVEQKTSLSKLTEDITMYDRSKLVYKDFTTIQADEFSYTGNNEPIIAKGNVVIEKKNLGYYI